MKVKCNLIESISDLNLKIKNLTHALTLLKLGKITSALVPGLSGMILLNKASEGYVLTIIQTLTNLQNLQTKSILMSNFALSRCSIPDYFFITKTNPEFVRLKDWESEFTNTEGVLKWKNINYLAETFIYSKDLVAKSFAHCKPMGPTRNFLGEKYTISFQELRRPLPEMDNWRWSSP